MLIILKFAKLNVGISLIFILRRRFGQNAFAYGGVTETAKPLEINYFKICTNMNKNKQASYEAPTTNVLELRFEGALLTGSYGEQGKAGTLGSGNVYNFGDDDD